MQILNFKNFAAKYLGTDEIQLEKVLAALPKVSKNGPWICGGAIRRTINKENLDSDFDFFFNSELQAIEFVINIKVSPLIKVISEKENEFNVSLQLEILDKKIEVQVIKMSYYKSIEDCLDSFDFTICQFGYDGENLVCGDTALYDLGRKRLMLNKLTYPVASFRRVLKYTKQGYYACSGFMQEFLKAVTPQSLNEPVKYLD